MAQVTAGWEITYLRKYCAQLATSMSAAQGGSFRSAACRKSVACPKGRLASTPILRSSANGRIASAASRLANRIVDLDEIERVVVHDLQHLCVLADPGGGRADVTDAPRLLPLLHRGDQLRHAVQIVHLQQIYAPRPQPLERPIEAGGAARRERIGG